MFLLSSVFFLFFYHLAFLTVFVLFFEVCYTFFIFVFFLFRKTRKLKILKQTHMHGLHRSVHVHWSSALFASHSGLPPVPQRQEFVRCRYARYTVQCTVPWYNNFLTIFSVKNCFQCCLQYFGQHLSSYFLWICSIFWSKQIFTKVFFAKVGLLFTPGFVGLDFKRSALSDP